MPVADLSALGVLAVVLLSGTGGVLVKETFVWLRDRRKLGADADKVDAEAEKVAVDAAAAATNLALSLVEPLGRQVNRLEQKLTRAEAELDQLRATVRETTSELDACRAQNRAKDERLREQGSEIERLRSEGRL